MALSLFTSFVSFEIVSIFYLIISMNFGMTAGQSSPSSQLSSLSATPICLQPRVSPRPGASAISSALESAVPKACDVKFQKTYNTNLLKTLYYNVDSFSFNMSHSALEVNQAVAPAALCPDTFSSIIDGCVSAPRNGFWGGWIMRDGTNYSISNFVYPKNGLLNPSSVAASIATTPAAGAGASSGSSGPAPASSQSRALTSPGPALSGSGSKASTPNNPSSNQPDGQSSAPLPSSSNNGPGPSTQPSAVSNSADPSPPSSKIGSPGTADPPPTSSGSASVPITGASPSESSKSAQPSQARSQTSGSSSGEPLSSRPLGGSTSTRAGTTGAGSSSRSGSGQPPISNSGSPSSVSNGGSASNVPGSSTNAGPNTPSGSGQPPAASATSNAGSSGSPPSVSNGGSATNVPGSATNAGPSSSSIRVIVPSGSGLNEQYSLASGLIATGNPTSLVIEGETLTPGGIPYTDASNTISLQTGGLINVDGTTVRLINPTAPTTPTSLPGSGSASSKGSASSSGGPASSGSDSASSKGGASSNNNPPSSGGATQGATTSAGPGTTSSPGASSTDVGIITGTITSAPPDMSTQSTSNTEWTDNTWLTTEKDGQTTIVPVIVGCPNCGGLHGGIILWNLPELPKVSFQFPKFPELPPFHLPCINVFGVTVSGDCSSPPQDDNPDNEDPNPSQDPSQDSSQTSTAEKTSTQSSGSSVSSKSSSSSSGCPSSATKVVSDCSVLCGSISSTQTCSTTCFSTITACSATGTTITSSASASEPSCYSLLPGGSAFSGLNKRAEATAAEGCSFPCPTSRPPIPTTGPLSVNLPSSDPGDVEKRAVAGRTYHVIEKRKKAVTIAAINGCNLATPAGQPVTTPSYPGGYEFWASETNGVLPQSYQAISRYYRTTPSVCIPTITAVPANQLNPVQNSGDNNNENSIDHAYENGWLTSFMESIVNHGGNTLTCNELNGIFFTPSCNFLEPIFGALASATNPDFVAMSQYLNGDAKGWILGSNYATPPDLQPQHVVQSSWSWANSYQMIYDKLGTVEGMLLGCLMVQAPNLIDMIQKTNNRIYAYFEYIDQSLAADPSIPRYNFGFAQHYKDYMNNFAAQWNGVPDYVSKLIRNVGDDLKTSRQMPDVVSSEWNSMYQLYANWLSQYEYTNTAAWKYNINLAFDTQNTKRDLLERAAPACSLIPKSGLPSEVSTVSRGSQSGTNSATQSGSQSAPTTSNTQPGSHSSTTIPPSNTKPPSTITSPPSTTSSSPPLACSAGSNIGLDLYDPETWCGCNTGTAIYPTLPSGSGDAACNYKTIPSTTVHPTVVPYLSCSAGSNIGLATYAPATWCGCDEATGKLFPTMATGSGDGACLYHSLPKKTVNPTIVSAS